MLVCSVFDKKLYWVFPRPGPGAGGGEQKEVGLAVEKNLGSQVRKTWARNSRGRKNWSPAYPPNMQDRLILDINFQSIFQFLSLLL